MRLVFGMPPRLYDLPLAWVRWNYRWPNGIPTRRGFSLRVWRIGFALAWDGCGKFHKTNIWRGQLTWNHGWVRWTLFSCNDYELWLEVL